MTVSTTAFSEGLYREHLEEISFLYEQRLALLDDPDVEWPAIGDLEGRLEAHLDALVVGGEHAMEVCLQAAEGDDFGELYAALRLLCRQNRLDQVKTIIAGLAAGDRDKLLAAGDALKLEIPVEWLGELVDFMNEDPPTRVPVVARAIGFRRFQPTDSFADLLAGASSDIGPELIWALGRIRSPSLRSVMQPCLSHAEASVSSEAALALLRIGDADTLNTCLSVDEDLRWSLIPMALGGSAQHVPRIMKQAEMPDALLALGLLGHLSAVDALLTKLEDDELKASAAMALQVMTGADLHETVFVPEEVDEDELTPEELERHRSGEAVQPPGERAGATITRLSESPEQWKRWWSENQSSFRPDLRYRNGVAYSPAALVDVLASTKTPRRIRQLAYEELVVRYNADFPFETDMPVSEQLEAIRAYRSWVAEQGDQLQDGNWYFAGRTVA